MNEFDPILGEFYAYCTLEGCPEDSFIDSAWLYREGRWAEDGELEDLNDRWAEIPQEEWYHNRGCYGQ